MIGQRSEWKHLTRRSTVRNLRLRTLNLLTHLPSQGLFQTPDVTLLSRHLLPDVTWSTHTTLRLYHLPIAISVSGHTSPSPRKIRSYTNFRKAEREGYTAKLQRSFAETPLPTSCSAGEKSSGVSSATPEDTTFPEVMLGTIAPPPYPTLCDPSSWRGISTALTVLSTLPPSCWT